MDAETRHRLTALEDRARESLSHDIALRAILSCCAPFREKDLPALTREVTRLASSHSDAVALEARAKSILLEMLREKGGVALDAANSPQSKS